MMNRSRNRGDTAGGLLLLLLLVSLYALRVVLTSPPAGARSEGGAPCVTFARAPSAFQRITLGLPVSINRECVEDLTAIPGIGPKTAERIVEEREKRDGFQNIKELTSVMGIGPKLYKKIKPFIGL